MNPKEADDVKFALERSLSAYRQRLSPDQWAGWLDAVREHEAGHLCEAISLHTKASNRAPTPADVLRIAETLRARSRGFAPHDDTEQRTADPQIGAAWLCYFAEALGVELPGERAGMDWETALCIVNREAAKYGRPDAVLPQHRLPQFWNGV